MDSVPMIDFSWHVVTLSERWRRRGGFGVAVFVLDVRGVDSASLFNEELEVEEGEEGP